MKRVDAEGHTHISALGWVFVMASTTLIAVLATLAAIVLLVVRANDQSEQNQRHIDCIVALAQPTIPESCESVKAHLIDDGIITQSQLDASRPTTTVA